MKRMIFIASLAFLVLPLIAQTVQPQISFQEKGHDFGKFQEAEGKVTYNFEFVNPGGSPLIIQNVTASCGCTASQWTREPVPPGGKGYVAATYNPAGRPGTFRKYITVISNANPASVRLYISGEVEPKPRTIEDDYRYAMGPIRLKSNHLAFGNVKNTSSMDKNLALVNNSEETVSVKFQRVPAHIQIRMEPEVLKPGEKGEIVASYDAKVRNDWGFVIDRMMMEINGTTERNYSLVVSANIEEDFAALSESELANAPVAVVDGTEFKFGQIKQGEKVEHIYSLTNSGKTDLYIRKVKASCGCTAVQPEKRIISPGESVNIKTVFNSAGKMGNQNKTVTIITNDPKNSKLILWVKGEVVKS